jgi:hypothetical protein
VELKNIISKRVNLSAKTLKKIKQHIDRQFDANRSKNLFFNGIDSSLQFIHQTVNKIDEIKELNDAQESLLLDYITEKALQEFWRVNQYYTFDKESQEDLRSIYNELLTSLKKLPIDVTDDRMNRLGMQHYENLKQWLRNTNAFAEKAYRKHGELVGEVPCSEYSAQLQMEILHIDPDHLLEPVLDIGCGKSATLIKYLQELGLNAFGIDRATMELKYCNTADWLEYTFRKNSWGTIISHLSFANHFKHHHFREDGNYLTYAKKYLEILQSLKPGGTFYYVPELPFIEDYLDRGKYTVTRHPVGSFDFKSVKIQKL